MDGYGAVYGGRVKGTHIAANLQVTDKAMEALVSGDLSSRFDFVETNVIIFLK